MNTTSTRKGQGFGLFMTAAILYITGAVIYSLWSFHHQRTSIATEFDQSLINATFATEQILGSIFIQCAVETEKPLGVTERVNYNNLNQFAENCRFDLIGVAGYKNEHTWTIACGDRQREGGTAGFTCLNTLIRDDLANIIRDSSHIEKSTTVLHTKECETCGRIRIALGYRPVDAESGYVLVVASSTEQMDQQISAVAAQAAGIGILLNFMAFPLIILYRRTQSRSTRETEELNAHLQQDFIQLKEREAELEDAIRDLERFNSVAIGRETRIIELKREVNTLLKKMDQKERYNTGK